VPQFQIQLKYGIIADHLSGPGEAINAVCVSWVGVTSSDVFLAHEIVNCGIHSRNVTTTTVLRPFFRHHAAEPVPEENFWTLWCKGRLTETDTLTIWLGATPSGLTSAHLHHPQFLISD